MMQLIIVTRRKPLRHWNALALTGTLWALGGDEFTILQPVGCSGAEDAMPLAEKILQVIARPFEVDCHHLKVETSIGVALAPPS
jgi:GGDEF domain-containing protein